MVNIIRLFACGGLQGNVAKYEYVYVWYGIKLSSQFEFLPIEIVPQAHEFTHTPPHTLFIELTVWALFNVNDIITFTYKRSLLYTTWHLDNMSL